MLTLPTDEEYRWLASQWTHNRRQNRTFMLNSKCKKKLMEWGKRKKRPSNGHGKPTNVTDDLIIVTHCEEKHYAG